MSGAQSGGKGSPPPAGGAPDPSMEDILASIRRILSEDDGAPEAAAAPAVHAPVAAAPAAAAAVTPAEPDLLELDASMLIEPEQHPEPEMPPVAIADLADFTPPRPEPPVPVIAPPAVAAIDTASIGLVAPAAAAAAASSLTNLVRTLAERQSLAVHRGGPTLEDIVREEMRPMLKTWLDEYLPPLVERLVRTEIERVVGRATS